MLKVHEVKKVYCYEYDHYINENGQNCCKVEYTTDESVARELDKNYRWTDIDEIQESIGLGFDVVEVVETESGIFGYYEVSYIDSFGDLEWFGEYVKIGMGSDEKIKDFRKCIERSIAEMK